MAAHSNSSIRVRVLFDYPPPAVVDSRKCWLLVDLNTCRVVADLESVIRDKFGFSRRSILSLFIDDCYLLHTESVYVVRDNDSIRVKVDCLAQVNGLSSCPDTASETCRKRPRPTEEDGPVENGESVEWKKKKRKKKSEELLERDTKQVSGDERNKKSPVKKKKKKKKKKKIKKAEENGPTVTPKPVAPPKPAVTPKPTVTPKPAASTRKSPASADQPVKSTKKPPVAPATPPSVSSSDSSSSSSEEDEAPRKPAAQKAASRKPSSTPTAASKAPPTTTQTKSQPPSSSSSESSSDEATAVKSLLKTTSTTPKGRRRADSNPQQAPPALQPTNGAQKRAASVAVPLQDKTATPCDSDSEEEIKLVIRRPMQQPGLGTGGQWSWRGGGRGQSRHGGSGERGRGGGRGGIRGHNGSSELSCNGATEPSCHTDSLSNVSVVLQNGAEGAPKQDYSSMPLLAAPPQVGQRIAFKLLELTENYTPEVSDYKEAKIVTFDLTTKQIELELLNTCQAPVEPGKFDLVYQNPDGSESVEYAVTRGSRVTERWDSLLEPRLIL